MRKLTLGLLCFASMGLTTVGCGTDSDVPTKVEGSSATTVDDGSPASTPSVDVSLPAKLNASHLPNAIRVHEKVISGGQPEGEAAFQELQNLGVRTVISVDGAAPDLVLAKKHGLRYVHLPHGYDGISEQRIRELAKAVRELDGPIYIHCHHGKHRSPAAAATACISAGLVDKSQAGPILKIAGTNPNYRGLFEVAESAEPLNDAILASVDPVFPEVATLPPAAEAMVALEHTQDRLKSIAASGWKPPENHPDLDPAHEALLLKEHFTEMLRAEWAATRPPGFQDLLRDSESAATELEEALRKLDTPVQQSAVPAAIQTSFERVSKNCTACHQQFRDVPLTEKHK